MAEAYAKHKGILTFLGGVGLLDAYYEGRPIESVRTRHLIGSGILLSQEDEQSWAISLGYVPRDIAGFEHTPVFLTTDFLYGNDMEGYAQRLIAQHHTDWHDPDMLTRANLM